MEPRRVGCTTAAEAATALLAHPRQGFTRQSIVMMEDSSRFLTWQTLFKDGRETPYIYLD